MDVINLGYSPENLRSVLSTKGLSREKLADMLDVSLRAVHRWCAPVESKEHRDMPYQIWRDLVWWSEGGFDQWLEFTIPFGMAGEKDLKAAWNFVQQASEQAKQANWFLENADLNESSLERARLRRDFLDAAAHRADRYHMALCQLNPENGVIDSEFVRIDEGRKLYVVQVGLV